MHSHFIKPTLLVSCNVLPGSKVLLPLTTHSFGINMSQSCSLHSFSSFIHRQGNCSIILYFRNPPKIVIFFPYWHLQVLDSSIMIVIVQQSSVSKLENCSIKAWFIWFFWVWWIFCHSFHTCFINKLIIVWRPQVVGHTSLLISSRKGLALVWTKKMRWIVLWQEQIFCLRWKILFLSYVSLRMCLLVCDFLLFDW